MTSLETFLAGPFGQALGGTLLHFLWQGSLIAALLGVALFLARRHSPTLRYALACGALLLMAAAPPLTLAHLRRTAQAPEATSADPDSAPRVASARTPRSAPALPPVTRRLTSWLRATYPALQPWMLIAWSFGVTVLSLRYLGGWAAAQRLKSRRARLAASDWQATLDRLAARLRVSRPVRLLESAAVRVPTALGVWKPVVLVPAAAVTGFPASHLEALLAHELAHVRRHDYLVNLIQSAVETVLFYHPAVWWVSRRARVERENCCDDLAIAATGSARVFARALADLEESRASAFRLQTAADGGVLRRRVQRLVSGERSEYGPRPLVAAVALALLFGTGAAVRLSSPEESGSPALFGSTDAGGGDGGTGLEKGDPLDGCGGCAKEGLAGGKSAVSDGVARGVARAIRASVSSAAKSAVARAVEDAPFDAVVVSDAGRLAQDEPKKGRDAPVSEPDDARAQKISLSVEHLVAFKTHGVTTDFIRQVASAGYARPSPDELIALRIHGVTPDLIRAARRTWGRVDLEEIVSAKIHGLTPEFAEEMKKTGVNDLSFDELISMKVHGVTPEYVRQAQSSGFGPLSAEQVVSLKIHGVDARDAEKWKALDLPRPTFDQVLSAKIHGLTPEFVGEMRKLGFSRLDLDELVAMRIHGVTPAFVAQVRQLGYANVTADEVTSLRVHGISGEALQAYRAAAPRLSLEEVIQLKVHGIDASELARMLRDGRLSVDDLSEDTDDEKED